MFTAIADSYVTISRVIELHPIYIPMYYRIVQPTPGTVPKFPKYLTTQGVGLAGLAAGKIKCRTVFRGLNGDTDISTALTKSGLYALSALCSE